MLDFRIETFLVLCETRSYVQAAERLHITQPAVTQHIKHLEKQYGVALFRYANRTLSLTPQGEQLQKYALAMQANNARITAHLCNSGQAVQRLAVGATLSIGEFVLAPLAAQYLAQTPELRLTFTIANTRKLLRKIDVGTLDCAFVEGRFDRQRYGSRLFQRERFVGVCGGGHPLAGQTADWDRLLRERLILREEGSGTRDILEQCLHERNLTLAQFSHRTEVNNFAAIKELVRAGVGITFVYEPVVRRELERGELVLLDIPRFRVEREFNFVYQRENLFMAEPLAFFAFCLDRLENRQETDATSVSCLE